MTSLRILPALLVCSALAGCGASAPQSTPVSAPAGPDSPPSASADPPTDALAAQLVGTWGPTLPRRQARAVAIARWALADPHNDQAFETIGPSDEERENFRSLVRLRDTEPESPRLEDVRRKLADYEAMLIVISPTHITFGTAASQNRQPYRVVEARGDALVLDSASERIEVRFLDHDHLAMHSGTTMLLTRDAPTGYNAKDLRGEVPTGLEPVARPPAPSPAGAPSGAVDACSAYADCIDQMPQMAGDQPVMLASASTIRGWERTAERLQQCASALKLARSIGLCR